MGYVVEDDSNTARIQDDECVLSVLIRGKNFHGLGNDRLDVFLGERFRNVGVDLDRHHAIGHVVTSLIVVRDGRANVRLLYVYNATDTIKGAFSFA